MDGCMFLCYKAANNPLACLGFIISFVVLRWLISFRDFDYIYFKCNIKNICLFCCNSLKCYRTKKSNELNPETCIDGCPENVESNILRKEIGVVMERLGMSNFGENKGNMGSYEKIVSLFEEDEPRMEEVEEAFGVFDENGDGFIDAKELNRIMGNLGFKEASEEQCQMMINTFDYDEDGKISIGEFVKLLEHSFSN